ncbi:MAG: glycosyltransferase family 39 protein [Candidatus Levybacteria bacterium]|nr:glycosyltransferase family 39 protein [Candidatus Levybacteria bacterium]
MLNKKFTYILLGIIFFIAVLFRFVNLSSYPAGFHIDEASLGYNGYSLLLTGKDDNGNSFPLYIDMFGDNRPSGYHYLTIVPIVFFGLTEFATRFPAALIGSLTVFAMFFLASVIFNNKAISLLSALLIAVSPWHIVISRASGEAVVALFLIITGFSLLLQGLMENKNKPIILGAILVSISYFLYHTPRVFVPLVFTGLISFLYPLWKGRGKFLYAKILTVVIFLCGITLLLVFVIKGGTGRYSQVNIFNNFETNFFISQERQEDALANSSAYISRIVHNKITNYLRVFSDNYLNYFSGSFLFSKGGLPLWYNVPRMGLMYIIELPFLIFGAYVLIKSRNLMHKLPILWLVIAPVVAAITMDDIPNVNRAIVMIPALEIIVAVGLFNAVAYFGKNKMLFAKLIVVLFLGNIFYFSHQYFINATVHNNWYRNNGFSEMMKVVNENYDKYDSIVISKFQGGIYPLVLFYSKYNPATYQKEGSPKNADYKGFGKFFFVPQDCPSVSGNKKNPLSKKTLYLDKGDCPESFILKDLKTAFIYTEDGAKAFRVVYD